MAAYSKRYAGGFVDTPTETTAIDSTFLNAVEDALVTLYGVTPATNGAMVWDGSQFTAASKIVNANIDSAAAISKSKLDFTGGSGIVDADIASAAAIAQSKISGLAAAIAAVAVPAGSITAYGAASAPTGWLLCDGSSVLRATYVDLFTAIGTTYGTADGTHFTLPDLRGRAPVGYVASGGHTDVSTLSNSDGITLASRRPKHSHTITGGGGVSGGTSAIRDTSDGTPATHSGLVGVGTAPVDTPAYLVVNFIIKT